MTCALGIDIGGTGVKYSLVEASGHIHLRHYDRLAPGLSGDDLVQVVCAGANNLLRQAGRPVAGIGLVTPGHIERTGYCLVDGGENLAALTERPLVPPLAAATGLPVLVENDALAAAMGEMLFGAGRAIANFAMLTLGTGVGGGLVLGGRLVHGPDHQPPEFGAIVLDLDGPPNAHDQTGTLEAYAGRAGFAAAFAHEGHTGDDLLAHFEAARTGDTGALRAIEKVARRIAQAIGIIANVANIERCIIGGGVSGAGALLIDAITHALPAFTWPALLPNLDVVLAETGNDAGTLGAAALVFAPERIRQ